MKFAQNSMILIKLNVLEFYAKKCKRTLSVITLKSPKRLRMWPGKNLILKIFIKWRITSFYLAFLVSYWIIISSFSMHTLLNINLLRKINISMFEFGVICVKSGRLWRNFPKFRHFFHATFPISELQQGCNVRVRKIDVCSTFRFFVRCSVQFDVRCHVP